jgi:hypothetical protein
MREPHRPQRIFAANRGDQRTAPTPLCPLPPEIKFTTTEIQTTTPHLDKGQLITPPDASDVRILKINPKTALDKPTQCATHVHPHPRKLMTDELQIEKKMPSTALIATPTANDSHSKPQRPPERTPAIREEDLR